MMPLIEVTACQSVRQRAYIYDACKKLLVTTSSVRQRAFEQRLETAYFLFKSALLHAWCSGSVHSICCFYCTVFGTLSATSISQNAHCCHTKQQQRASRHNVAVNTVY
jgi:hypothetical protein